MDITGEGELYPHNFNDNLGKVKSKLICRDEEIAYIFRLLGQVRCKSIINFSV